MGATINDVPSIGKHFQMTLVIRDTNFTSVYLDNLFRTEFNLPLTGIHKPNEMKIVTVELVETRSLQEIGLILVPSQSNLSAGDLEYCDGAMSNAEIVR
jgi:hypothetical protein